jgi:hypothetical protein
VRLAELGSWRLRSAIVLKDDHGPGYFTTDLHFWSGQRASLDALLERIVRESEQAAAETWRAA